MFTFCLKLNLPKCRAVMRKQNIHIQKKKKYNYFTSENVMDYRSFIKEFQTNSFSFETVLKYRILLKTPINVLQQNYALCKENGVTFMSPVNTATLLSLPLSRMRHNIGILKECGSIRLTDYNVARLQKLMKLQIETFKNVANIPQEVNVVEEIHKNVFSNSYKSTVFESLHENMTFFELRSLLIPHYIFWKFNISISNQNTAIRKIFFFKSWQLVNKNIDFLKNNIGFKFNTKLNNIYAVKCDLNNVKRMCQEIKNIDQIPMPGIINKCPQILLQSTDSIKGFLTWYRRNRLKEHLILNNLKVFSLKPEKAIKNMEKILKNPTLVAFQNYPRFLSLLFVNHNLTKRIAYLESQNMVKSWKNIIIPFNELNKSNKKSFQMKLTNSKEFLNIEFPNQGAALFQELKKNSNWHRIDLFQMFESLQYLKEHFSVDAISSNIHIILYDRFRIDKTLEFVRHRYNNYNNQLSPSQHLALCLYHLEVEYHFSGDSILHKTEKRVDNKC